MPFGVVYHRLRVQGSTCRACRAPIERGALRVGLMLQCHTGYKCCAYVHGGAGCAGAHPEAHKLLGTAELVGARTHAHDSGAPASDCRARPPK